MKNTCSILKKRFPDLLTSKDIKSIQKKLSNTLTHQIITMFDFKIIFEFPEIKKCIQGEIDLKLKNLDQ